MNLTKERRCTEWLRQAGKGLAFIRSEGGDVDESYNFGIVAGFSDDGAAAGMTGQQDRPGR
jgi:hypothetical protein